MGGTCRREGDGVPEGEVDCFDVDIVLECDDTVIDESGRRVEDRLEVLLIWLVEDFVSCWIGNVVDSPVYEQEKEAC